MKSSNQHQGSNSHSNAAIKKAKWKKMFLSRVLGRAELLENILAPAENAGGIK
jgi:hypothetical protein